MSGAGKYIIAGFGLTHAAFVEGFAADFRDCLHGRLEV